MPLASLAFRKFRRLKDGSGRSAGSTRVCVHRTVLRTATTMSSPEQRESKSSQEQTELYPRPQDCLASVIVKFQRLESVQIQSFSRQRYAQVNRSRFTIAFVTNLHLCYFECR